MGASTWNYFVPYDPEVSRAFARLRNDVFANGQYGDGVPSTDGLRAMLSRMMSRMPDSEDTRRRMEEGIAEIERLRSQIPRLPRPSSIQELLAQRAENGTHSILDIQKVAEKPEFGAVSEMPEDEIVRVFGTNRPTRMLVESKLCDEGFVEHPLVAERWQGVYLRVYREDEPVEWFFIGTSGD